MSGDYRGRRRKFQEGMASAPFEMFGSHFHILWKNQFFLVLSAFQTFPSDKENQTHIRLKQLHSIYSGEIIN